MATQVLMPALSPTMEKGNLAKWLKREGDPVKPGDVIAEIETDKATMEVEAIDEGVLGKILVPEGSNDVAVNTPIATILEDGETAAADSQPKTASVKPAAEPAKPSAAAAAAPPQLEILAEADVPARTKSACAVQRSRITVSSCGQSGAAATDSAVDSHR